MEIFLQLCLLLIFELLMLIGLFQYYLNVTKGGLEVKAANYAKWLSYSLPLLMLSQISSFLIPVLPADWFLFPLYTLSAAARLMFYGFVLYGVNCAVSKTEADSYRWLKLAAALFVLISLSLFLKPVNEGVVWALLHIPSVLMLVVALMKSSPHRTTARLGLSSISVVLMLFLASELLLMVGQGVLAMTVGFLEGYWLCGLFVMLVAAMLLFDVETLHRKNVRQLAKINRQEKAVANLEAQFQVAQKMEGMGLLSAGIAHDVNNMLTSILGYTNLALRKLSNDDQVKEDLYMVMSGARQAADLTGQMLNYTQASEIKLELLNLSRLVEELTPLIRSVTSKKVHLAFNLPTDLPLFQADRVQVSQILLNLVANATEAIDGGVGVVKIHSGFMTLDEDELGQCRLVEKQTPGTYLFLKVEDDGKGMSESDLEHIFEPFFSSKTKNKGLGLSSIKGLLSQHHGFMQVESNQGSGSQFVVYFPVAMEVESEAVSPVFEQGKSQGTVLIVDDDQRIKSLMSSILEAHYFRSITAGDGKQAWLKFERHRDVLCAAVLDCAMPKMSGAEVYQKIRSVDKTLPIIMVSGFEEHVVMADIDNDKHAYFVQKPFEVDDFSEVVQRSIAAAEAAAIE